MLSESWLKGKLGTHKGQIESEEKADYDQYQESDDSDHHDVQVEASPE